MYRKKKLNNSDVLSTQYNRNLIINYIFKSMSLLMGLVSVKVFMGFLGNNLYGEWTTVSSIANWANYGDFGIGNGLRNKLATAYAEKDVRRQKGLIAASFFSLTKLALYIFLVLTVVSEVLLCTKILDINLRIPMHITNFFMCVNFCFSIFPAIAYAFQRSGLNSVVACLTSVSNVLAIYLLSMADFQSNLTLFAIVMGTTTLLINVIYAIIIQRLIGIKFISLCREMKNEIGQYKSDVFSLGLRFFVLQFSCLILYSTDNVVINYLFGGTEVTTYSIITKVFTAGDNLYSVALISLWSAVTYAVTKNNIDWIRQQIRKYKIFWLVFSLGVIVVSLSFNWITHLWLGEQSPYFDTKLIAVFAIYAIANAFGSIYVNIANGLGELKIQLIFAIIGSIINVPLSVFLARNVGLGIVGVKVATLICSLGSIVIVPIQISRKLNNKQK